MSFYKYLFFLFFIANCTSAQTNISNLKTISSDSITLLKKGFDWGAIPVLAYDALMD